MSKPVEHSIVCPNCGIQDTLDFKDGNLDTARYEEHAGILCRATTKYYQLAKGIVYHKCTESGDPITVYRSNTLTF